MFKKITPKFKKITYLIASIVIIPGGIAAYAFLDQSIIVGAHKSQDNIGISRSSSIYTNGVYTVTGNYLSPGGAEEIDVTITLEKDVIIAIEVTAKATRSISQAYQQIFVENYQPHVVGKNINELQLDVIAGSSLTPKGFNDALEKIKQQARS